MDRLKPIQSVPSVEATPHNAGEVSNVLGTTSALRCASRRHEARLSATKLLQVEDTLAYPASQELVLGHPRAKACLGDETGYQREEQPSRKAHVS
jgi:hypothetical protein